MEMLASIEFVQLQQALWELTQESTQREQAVAMVQSVIIRMAQGLWFPLLVALLLIPLVAVLYRPRVPRGALWLPAFGIFGGTPKFYSHSRPASFAGLFGRTRRRVATKRSHRG